MSVKRFIVILLVILAVAALPLFGAASGAAAQTSPLGISQPSPALPPSPSRYARPRIEINPPRLLYRRCVDWYELQHRPSGTVLYPQMRCWWVRG